MTAPSTKDVNGNPYDIDLIADPYPLVKRTRQRSTTTIQKEAAS